MEKQTEPAIEYFQSCRLTQGAVEREAEWPPRFLYGNHGRQSLSRAANAAVPDEPEGPGEDAVDRRYK
jgi:hypothetical protein